MSKAIFPDEFTLLHNPRCSKSRAAKALLEERGVAVRERRYLEEPLTRAELDTLSKRLGASPREWLRRGEEEFRQAGLSSSSTDAQILDAMARFPILIERPILIAADRAVVGRPPDKVLELVD